LHFCLELLPLQLDPAPCTTQCAHSFEHTFVLDICWVHPQGLIKAELDSCDGGRPVYLMGESFGGLMVMALAIKLEAYIDRYVDAVVGRFQLQVRQGQALAAR
jgi:hypothetical protein